MHRCLIRISRRNVPVPTAIIGSLTIVRSMESVSLTSAVVTAATSFFLLEIYYLLDLDKRRFVEEQKQNSGNDNRKSKFDYIIGKPSFHSQDKRLNLNFSHNP